jgi:hypothetical protein
MEMSASAPEQRSREGEDGKWALGGGGGGSRGDHRVARDRFSLKVHFF